MTLNVSPCGSRQSWDARVRVTGGHPELLWGIGDAEALTHDDVRVERVAVDRGESTVGYGQLLIHPQDRHTVVDARSLHVKNPQDLLAVLAALQDHARTVHDAAVLRASPDTHATLELAEQLTEAGYRRRDKPRRGEAGPRHLVVRLGETEGDLSQRLSSETLQRCRAGLRDSGVRVRRVNASDRDLSHVGLRTQHIRELLRAVGKDSVFLVATDRPDQGREKALGYLWFVHTGESAMIYRLGFTDQARELGVDDALLLTGLVQLQQRMVHKVLAGDPDQPGQPMVLRELATEDQEVLGTWEFPLAGEFQIAGRAEKTRRRFFRRRARTSAAEELLPDDDPRDPAARVVGGVSDDLGVISNDDDDVAAGTVDADPDLARPGDVVAVDRSRQGAPGPAAQEPDAQDLDARAPGSPTPDPQVSVKTAGPSGRSGLRAVAAPARVVSRAAGAVRRTTRRTTDAVATGPSEGKRAAAVTGGTAAEGTADGLLRRAFAEGRAAVRDAARW